MRESDPGSLSERDAVELRGKGRRSTDERVGRVDGRAGDAVLEAKRGRDVAVRRSRAVAAAAGAVRLRDVGAGALAGREAAAPLLALGVGCARGEHDLLARLGRGGRRSGGGSSGGCGCSGSGVVRSGGRELQAVEVRGERGRGLDGGVREVAVYGAGDAVGEAEGLRDVAVGRRGAEAAATVTGLCN
jgi:hypothetical protein